MEKVTAVEKIFEGYVFEAATYIRKYGGGGWRVVGVRKRP